MHPTGQLFLVCLLRIWAYFPLLSSLYFFPSEVDFFPVGSKTVLAQGTTHQRASAGFEPANLWLSITRLTTTLRFVHVINYSALPK